MGRRAQEKAAKKLALKRGPERIVDRSPDEGNVMIKCPNTDKYVPTGVYADVMSYQGMTASNNSSQCSACGQMHIWGDNETMLDN